MQYTNKIHGINKIIRQITKCFKMLVNRPFKRINTIILWNIIKPTKSLQFIGMNPSHRCQYFNLLKNRIKALYKSAIQMDRSIRQQNFLKHIDNKNFPNRILNTVTVILYVYRCYTEFTGTLELVSP